tara:strand:+ start:6265 stop:6690 length:426 start_codon:yes stop_codon:yes gene_type:complete
MKQSSEKKAGITISVSRIKKLMRRGNVAKTIGSRAPVFLSGAIENVISSIIQQATEHADANKSNRVNTLDVVAAVRTDPDLARLFAGFAFGSTLPANKAIDYVLSAEAQKARRAALKISAARKEEAKEAKKSLQMSNVIVD